MTHLIFFFIIPIIILILLYSQQIPLLLEIRCLKRIYTTFFLLSLRCSIILKVNTRIRHNLLIPTCKLLICRGVIIVCTVINRIIIIIIIVCAHIIHCMMLPEGLSSREQ